MSKHWSFHWIAYGILMATNLIDLWYSQRAFEAGIPEGNPIALRIIEDHGLMGIAVFKGIFLGILFFFIPIIGQYKTAQWAFYAAITIYTALTFYHIALYLLR